MGMLRLEFFSTISACYMAGTFDGHVSLWELSGRCPDLVHQVRCSDKAISVINEIGSSKKMIAVGTEDGYSCLLELRLSQSKARLCVNVKENLLSSDVSDHVS